MIVRTQYTYRHIYTISINSAGFIITRKITEFVGSEKPEKLIVYEVLKLRFRGTLKDLKTVYNGDHAA